VVNFRGATRGQPIGAAGGELEQRAGRRGSDVCVLFFQLWRRVWVDEGAARVWRELLGQERAGEAFWSTPRPSLYSATDSLTQTPRYSD
jgi:hypothetical protein